MRYRHVLVSVAAVTVLFGCESDANRTQPDPNAQTLVAPLTIVGDWDVVLIETAAGEQRPVPGSAVPTLSFSPTVGAAGGRVDVFTGVNRGHARYDFTAGEGDVGALSIARFALTRMAGSEEGMRFENSLLTALQAIRTVTRSKGGIFIDCGDMRVQLVRRPVGG